jgi:hypothetical protein
VLSRVRRLATLPFRAVHLCPDEALLTNRSSRGSLGLDIDVAEEAIEAEVVDAFERTGDDEGRAAGAAERGVGAGWNGPPESMLAAMSFPFRQNVRPSVPPSRSNGWRSDRARKGKGAIRRPSISGEGR